MVMNSDTQSQHVLLQNIAHKAMLERGLLPDFPKAVLDELHTIQTTNPIDEPLRNLTTLLWCSIDNDDSRDLDQLTMAEMLPEGKVKIRVAVADVDSLVKKGSPIDGYASHFGLELPPEQLKAEAIEWSMTRGSRSGRVAWQFIQDLAGRLGKHLD